MEMYTFLRELADSWVLLMMTAFFIGTILWAFRPGSRAVHKDTADIPFRNESIATCDGSCDDCKSKVAFAFEPEQKS